MNAKDYVTITGAIDTAISYINYDIVSGDSSPTYKRILLKDRDNLREARRLVEIEYYGEWADSEYGHKILSES